MLHTIVKECCNLNPVMPPLNKEYEINRKEVKLLSKVGSHLGDEIWDGVWKKNEKITKKNNLLN